MSAGSERRGAQDGCGGRSRELWDLLEAVDRRIEDTPSADWDPAVKELAAQVSTGLADRLRQIAIEETLARAVPCTHPYCRHQVLVVDGVSNHIDSEGSPIGPGIRLAIPGDTAAVIWVDHEASPADEARQAELRAILDRSAPCAHSRCKRRVALVDGVVHHINDAGKLLGPRLSTPVAGADGHDTWAPHFAQPASLATGNSGDPGGAPR
jgi:hypothetical protein